MRNGLNKILLKVLLAGLPGLSGLAGCGGDKNVADCEDGHKSVPCTERTPDESARIALDEGDYEAAVLYLNEAIAAEPWNYGRYPLLAAAYAALGGIDILNLVQAQFGSGGTLIDQLATFLPDPAERGALYPTDLQNVRNAIATLELIPAGQLTAESDAKYAKSGIFQLTLYRSSYSVMYLNQFAISATTGELDLEQFDENMSEEDALVVLQTLAAAGSLGGDEDAAVVSGKVNEALADIEAQPGATRKEKLRAFLAKEEGGETPPETPAP